MRCCIKSYFERMPRRCGVRRLDAAFVRTGLTGRSEQGGASSRTEEKRRQAAALQRRTAVGHVRHRICELGAFTGVLVALGLPWTAHAVKTLPDAGVPPASAVTTLTNAASALPDKPGLAPASPVETRLLWHSTLQNGLAASAVTFTPVLAFFTSPDCVWCSRMKSEVFPDKAIQELLPHFTLVELDVTRHEKEAQEYQLQGVPAVVILSSDGVPRMRVGGYVSAARLQDILRGALSPDYLKKKDASYRELIRLLDSNELPKDRWPDVVQAMDRPERRRELRGKILALTPFPRRDLVALLQHPQLAVRLGAQELLEEVNAAATLYDPWLEAASAASNKVVLAQLGDWAEGRAGEASRTESSLFSALTREQVLGYLQDLLSDHRDRSTRALRMLENGGASVIPLVNEYLDSHPDLQSGARNRLKEVQYVLCLKGRGSIDASVLARKLLSGSLDIRVKAISELQNAGAAAMPVLKDFLHAPDAIVREAAMDAMVEAAGQAALPSIKARLAVEKDQDVVYSALKALGKVRGKRSQDLLMTYLSNANEDLVMAALKSLSASKATLLAQDLLPCLKDPRWRVRVAALETVGELKLGSLDAAVTERLADEDAFVRYTAVKTITTISAKRSLPKLQELFMKEDELKGAIVAAYASMETALPTGFAGALRGKSRDVILAVLEALENGTARDLALAEAYINDPDADVAVAAVRLLSARGLTNGRHRAKLRGILGEGKRDKVLAALEGMRGGGQRHSYGDDSRFIVPWGETDMPAGGAGQPAPAVPAATAVEDLLNSVESAPVPPPAGTAAPPPVVQSPATSRAAEDLLNAFDAETPASPAPVPADVISPAPAPVEQGSATEDLLSAFEGEAAPVPPANAGPKAIENAAPGECSARELGEAVVALVDKTEDAEIRFRGLLLLASWKHRRMIPRLEPLLSARTVADRLSVAEVLGQSQGKEAAPLFRRLLQDTAEDVRSAAARACLSAAGASGLAEIALEELMVPSSKLQPWEVDAGQAYNLRDDRRKSRAISQWAVRVLGGSAQSEAIQNLALIGLGMTGSKSDAASVLPLTKSRSPWQRRAAYKAIGDLDRETFAKSLDAVLADTSEYVRLVVPAVYMGDYGRWVNYYDATHPSDSYSASWRYYRSYGGQTRLSAAVRDALLKLIRDPVLAVRVEAYFCLLTNRETLDLAEFVSVLQSLPDQKGVSDRVMSFMSSHYTELGPGFAILLPYLERTARMDEQVVRIRAHFKASEDEAGSELDVVTRSNAVVAATYLPVARRPEGPQPFKLVYFTAPGCPVCDRVDRLLEEAKREYPKLTVEVHNIRKLRAMQMNEVLCERFGLPANRRLVAPALFAGAGALVKLDATPVALRELLARSESLGDESWAKVTEESLTQADSALKRRDLTFGVVAFGGLVDGVNPCAFATIIFLLSYLQITRRSPRQVAQVGLAFIAGVFVSYFLLGLGLMEVLTRIQAVVGGFRRILNGFLAAFSLVILALNVRDGFLCLRGRMADMTLQLPGFLKGRVHSVIRHGSRHAHFVIAAFIVGAVVSVIELACTGQVYLPIIGYMQGQGGNLRTGLAYLTLYNLMFVAPLFVIFSVACFGLTHAKLTDLLQRHAAAVKFCTAALFLFLFLFFVFGDRLEAFLRSL